MQIIPHPTSPTTRTNTQQDCPPPLQVNTWLLPDESYALGLAGDGLPVIARIAQGEALLAASDDNISLQALLRTIVSTAKFSSSRMSLGAIVVSRRPRAWYGLNKLIIGVDPQSLGRVILEYLENHPDQKLLVLLDNLGAGWEIEPTSLSGLIRAPQFHLFATTSPRYATRIQSLFSRMVIGPISDFNTLFNLTAPTTLTTPLAQGQFAIRHQSRWMTFSTSNPF